MSVYVLVYSNNDFSQTLVSSNTADTYVTEYGLLHSPNLLGIIYSDYREDT